MQKFTTFISEGIKHDRYERAHGKKAKGSGMWMFTTKRTGEPTEDEVFMSGPNMNLAAAGKEAMKALKSKEVYVMESVEQIEEESDSKEFQQEIDMIANMIKKGEHERLAKMLKRDQALKGGGGWNMAQKPSKKQKDQYNKMVRDHKKKHRDLYASYNEQIEEAPKIGKKGMVQGKDGKNYKIEMIPSNRSIEFKITNEFGDFETISVAQLAKKFR